MVRTDVVTVAFLLLTSAAAAPVLGTSLEDDTEETLDSTTNTSINETTNDTLNTTSNTTDDSVDLNGTEDATNTSDDGDASDTQAVDCSGVVDGLCKGETPNPNASAEASVTAAGHTWSVSVSADCPMDTWQPPCSFDVTLDPHPSDWLMSQIKKLCYDNICLV